MISTSGSSIRFFTVTIILFFAATIAVCAEKNATNKVASVNDSVITHQHVEQKMNELRQQFIRQGRPVDEQQFASLKGRVVDSLIDEELLFQESQKINIRIDQAQVDKSISDIRSSFKTEDEFLEGLKTMNLTKEDFLIKIKRSMATKKLIETKVESKIQISDKESQAFYNDHPEYFKMPEQVKASHILIKLDKSADALARETATKKLKDVQEQLKKGGDFAALAKKVSEGPSNVNGGDLGFFGRGQMVKPFEDAVFALKPGETSDIVETNFGLHLIKLTEKKAGGVVDYANAKEKIDQHLKQKSMQQGVMAYIDNLKKNAKIEKF